jgi:hypothetical protein
MFAQWERRLPAGRHSSSPHASASAAATKFQQFGLMHQGSLM